MIDRTDAENRVLTTGWLARQPDDFRRAMLKVARLIDFPAGEFVFHAGDGQGGIYGIVSGGVGVHLPSETSETILAHVLRAGIWFGYGPLVRGGERSMSFSLVEPSLLFHVPLANAQEIARRSFAHQHALLSISENGIEAAVAVIETLLIRNTDRRIAATLLRIAPDEGGIAHLTQAQLGEMANAERQMVNRVLKRLEGHGWLQVSYGRIAIVDRAALREFARAR